LQFENEEIKPTHRYLWGTKQDELICDNNNWTLGDHLNTIRDIIKSNGEVAAHLEYNAFGKLISETKNDPLSFAYTGKLFDKFSDLQWNINRWYDSNVGKRVSEDPIGFEGKDVNLFRYVFNSHLSLVDQLGRSATNIAFEAAGRALTVLTIGQLTQQAVGIGYSTSLTKNSTYTFDKLTQTAELDAELKKNRDALKVKNQCAKRHVVMRQLTIYNSDNGASSLRNTYALNREEATYSFDENSVKDQKPIRARYLYFMSVRCSTTTFCTCVSVYLSENGKQFDDLTNGGKLCDFGYSVKVRLFLTAYLYSYGHSDSEPVVTPINQEIDIWASFSCKNFQQHPQ
jgi:RHS repeat-associated protein